MRFPSILFLALSAWAGSLSAASYDVGPGQPLATLSAVPWRTLQPGDFVNIHSQPGGYHEKIQISASGTAAKHIVIRGIPDPTTSALPIIDGKDAVEDPSIDWRSNVFSPLGVIVVSPRKTGYLYGSYHVSYVDIETLDIRNATYTGNGSITYTDQFGTVRGYDTFACGIYIEWAHDLAVRGCEISNCGNGLFANSKNGVAQSSQRLLIEKNYFHDNSNPQTTDPNTGTQLSNGYGEHHIYVESAGSIIQYNRFGKLRPNAHGTAIKDRSAGQIIRYNEFDMDGESNVLALLDPQGGIGFIDQQPDYLDSYVYGNLVTIESYTSGIDAFWWGSYNGPGNLPGGGSSYLALHRRTLYFYNNTVVCHHNGVGLFFLPDSTYTGANPTYENVDCRNNIFFADTTVQSSIYNALHFFTPGTTNSGGDITLTQNWISPNWRKDGPSHTWSGALNGTANLLVGDSGGANNPRFVDINAHDYHILSGSNILDAAGPLSSAALPANDVTLEYLAPQNFQSRVLQGSSMDMGALESNGLATPPPAGGALQFSVGTFSCSESGGSATITVSRIGGSTGAVGVSYSTPTGGTATGGSDYTSVVGTLAWADGDGAAKTFTVPILNDSEIEVPETVSLALYAPTGGAVLGSLTSAALTILDDDTPPATLLYGLTATSNVLMLFKTDTPGTPLSFSYLSGLASGDILRALAVQPVTGKLFAVGSASVLYTLDPFTGVATAVGPAFTPALLSESMDMAFDRVTGLLRVVTAARQNLLLNPTTGAVVSTDGNLAFAAGDVNAGTTPILAGLDSILNGSTQTFYGIDAAKDVFVRLNSPATGQLTTVRALGFDIGGLGGFDIPSGATYGWAALSLQGANSCNLYAINLPAGNAIFLGTIRTVEQMRDIVIAPPRDVWKQTRFGSNAGIPAVAGDTADPDGNGVGNLIEYALGIPALNPSATVALPQTTFANNALTLTFTRPATANDLTYIVQVSDDLVTWNDGSSYAPSGNVLTNTFTTQNSRSTSNGLETISVRDNTPSSASRHFIRLKIVVP